METSSASRGWGRERISPTASPTVPCSLANNPDAFSPVRAENSLGRSRVSGPAPTPERIHCRTLPSRCSSKLPTAFSFSESRAHKACGGSSVRQVSMRSRFSASLSAAVVRKSASSVIHVSVEGSHREPVVPHHGSSPGPEAIQVEALVQLIPQDTVVCLDEFREEALLALVHVIAVQAVVHGEDVAVVDQDRLPLLVRGHFGQWGRGFGHDDARVISLEVEARQHLLL